MAISEGIIIAMLSLVGTLVGAYLSNRKTVALVTYRLEQLEKKVQAHNNLVERTYKLEEASELTKAELRRQNERLKQLESEG